jgi:hypothetical protein
MRAVRLPPFLLLASLAGAVLLSWPGVATAQKKRVGIPAFNGPQEALIRKKVMQAVKSNGFELVKSRQLEASAQTLGVSLDSNDGFKAVAKELSIAAFVTGEVGKKRAKLSVRNGADGSVSGEGAFAGANPRKIAAEVGKNFWRRLGSAVERGKPPSGAKKPGKATVAEAPEDDETTAEKDEPEETEKATPPPPDEDAEKAARVAAGEGDEGEPKKKKRKRRGSEDADVEASVEAEAEEEDAGPSGPLPQALDAFIGPRLFSRRLGYSQDIFRALRQYQLALGPSIGVVANFYPGAYFTDTFISNVGLFVGIEQAFGVTSKLTNGNQYPTYVHDWSGGARVRFPVGGMIEPSVLAAFGEHSYLLRSGPMSPRIDLDMPDTIYKYVRLGAQVRVNLPENFSITVEGSYRHLLGVGQLKVNYFPRSTAMGMDVSAGVGYRFMPVLEGRAGVDLRRYAYSMNSVPGDTFVAGGAVDQYITYWFGVAILLGGPEGGGGGGGAEEAPEESEEEKPERKKKSDEEEASE